MWFFRSSLFSNLVGSLKILHGPFETVGDMLEEWGAPGAIKGGVLMGSQVIRTFGRPYQMNVMSGQRSSCSLDTKCDT